MDEDDRDSGAPWTRIPVMIDNDVRRPALLSRLSAALNQPWTLTLVSAPAGAGKTRLLCQWAHEVGDDPVTDVVWLALPRGAVDLGELRSAIARVADRRLTTALERVSGAATADAARALARALSATDRRVVVIIDDVHHAESTQLGLLLSAFVQAVPGNAHVVLSGRGTGAVPVARRRITGVALELGVRDLAFAADEIRSFFRARDIRVSQGEISAILRRTEGWATGLQLMVVPAIDESHLTPLPLRGDAQAVADYFLEEVLADLDEELREFLLVTSVPEVFTLELAQALSKCTPTTMPIDRLVRLSVVAAQPGDEAVEYHYHPVLREFLLARLRARGRSTVEALEAIAAEWFAGRQDHPAALRHAILSGDPECIEVILRRCGMHLILTGHAAAVLEAITHVSPRLRADPAVRMLLAAAELDLGDASAAAAALPSLAGAGESVAARRWRTGIDLHTALRRGGLLEALDRGEPDLDEPIGEAPLDTYAHLQAAMGELYVGRLDRADEFARLASDQARTTGMAAAELQAGAILNTSALFRGRLRDVVDSATRLDDRWQALGRPESPFYEVTRVWRYWVPYEAMREDDAECALIAAAAVIDNGSEPAIARGLRGMLSLVRAERTDGPHDVALELLDTLAPRDDAPLPVHWYAMMGSFAVHAFHRLEEPTLRDCFLEAMTRGLGAAGDAGVMRAMAALHDRRHGLAREELATVLEGAAPCLLPASLIDAWLVEAALDVHAGEPDRAQLSLATALALAEPEGHARRVALADPVIGRLLAARATPGSRTRFADEVRERLATAGVLVEEELTERERVVLAALTRRATLRQIAQQEFISPNTVKTHVRNIYRKLGVSDREAVTAAAHALGIG
ncbi:hypothetical protein CSX12_06870 [Microbacterium sp. Y-01]|nr:hypothetical protein CSX12_06870 [Microbacterium sp. Y-01]